MRRSVFVEKENYRRRRVMDAVRILPFVALTVFLLPILWKGQTVPGTGLFIFGFWTLFIGISWFASARLKNSISESEDGPNVAGRR